VSRICNTSKAELGRKHHSQGRTADDIRTHIHTLCLTQTLLRIFCWEVYIWLSLSLLFKSVVFTAIL